MVISFFFTWLNGANQDIVKLCYKVIRRKSVIKDTNEYWRCSINAVIYSKTQYSRWPEVVLKAIFHSSSLWIHTKCVAQTWIWGPPLAIPEQRGPVALDNGVLLWLESLVSHAEPHATQFLLQQKAAYGCWWDWLADVPISLSFWCVKLCSVFLYWLSTKQDYMGWATCAMKPPQKLQSCAWSRIMDHRGADRETVTMGSWCAGDHDVELWELLLFSNEVAMHKCR